MRDSSLDLQLKSEKVLLDKFPEIAHVFSRIGTSEIALDPMGPNVADTYCMLKPVEQWRKGEDGKPVTKQKLGELMRDELALMVPGQGYLVTQPIQMRFNEIMAGARANLVCKIFGEDFEQLEKLAGEARTLVSAVPGASQVEFDDIRQSHAGNHARPRGHAPPQRAGSGPEPSHRSGPRRCSRKHDRRQPAI